MASSEGVLGVQIQHFENIHNAEIRNDMYCCCDTPDRVTPCGESTDAVKAATCAPKCDPYYVVHFQACPSIEACYVAKTFNITIDLSSEISSFLFQIPFNQSELETYNQVRIWNCLMNNTIYIKRVIDLIVISNFLELSQWQGFQSRN